MPIRKRGPSYQVDVRLPDGRRYRKTVATEEQALALEKALTTNPNQRRAMRLALQPSPGAMKPKAQPSTKQSPSSPEQSTPESSTLQMSPTSAPNSPTTPPATDTCATLHLLGYSGNKDGPTS